MKTKNIRYPFSCDLKSNELIGIKSSQNTLVNDDHVTKEVRGIEGREFTKKNIWDLDLS